MLIEENANDGVLAVNAYQKGIIEVGGVSYFTPVALYHGLVHDLGEKSFFDLRIDDFLLKSISSDFDTWPEIILIGSGEKQQFLHPKIVVKLAEKGIGLECMNTAAACRTFILLQNEGRRVWAWLWP